MVVSKKYIKNSHWRLFFFWKYIKKSLQLLLKKKKGFWLFHSSPRPSPAYCSAGWGSIKFSNSPVTFRFVSSLDLDAFVWPNVHWFIFDNSIHLRVSHTSSNLLVSVNLCILDLFISLVGKFFRITFSGKWSEGIKLVFSFRMVTLTGM